MSHLHDALSGFNGAVRLFPLPNLVLFPHVVQPLHVFEPRYRQLTQDALAGDRLITLALLKPGWEADYHKNPPIHPVVCVGKIFKETRLPDGRYNMLLHGLCRALLLEELRTDKLYRCARVGLLPDEPAPAQRDRELRRRLFDRMSHWFAAHAAALGQLGKLVDSDLSSGSLCDIFTFALPIEAEVKQTLLAESRVERRIERLITHLETTTPPEAPKSGPRKFPPEFSPN